MIGICIDCDRTFGGKMPTGRCNTCYQIQRHINSPLIKCQCSDICQEMIHSVGRSGHKAIRKFDHGLKANRNPNWKGGEYISSDGYVMKHCPNHPNCDGHGYVRKHRLVYEQCYKCCLLPWVEIDHINKNKLDNGIENLRPMYKSQHTSRHMKGRQYINGKFIYN